MAKGLTEKQRKILEYIIDFQKENGFPPTIRELGDAFAIGSLRGVTVHLDALVRKGYMTRERTSRSIRITGPDPRDPSTVGGASRKTETATRLPLVREIATGEKLPTESLIERHVGVPEELAAPATEDGFVIRVGATGVYGEPVLPGDLIVVRPQSNAAPGELIAVRSHSDIGVCRATGEEADILGRVVGLIRRY